MRFAARALAAVAGAAAVAGCGGSVTPGGEARTATAPPGAPRAVADALSLRRQVGQLLIVSFHGSTAPGYVHDVLRDGAAGGVILFGENVASAGQLRALTTALQRAGSGTVLVAVDQEGGAVRVVPFVGPAAAQAEVATPAAARAAARSAARALHRLGVNLALAPVADVAGGASSRSGRDFTGGPERVATLVRAAVRGTAEGHVGATVKHFPGFGAALANTDDRPVTIDASAATLRARDLTPFRAAIGVGVALVMASHALYPALDPRRIASQSPAVLQSLLRGELRFDGAVVTDSIEARAVIRRSDVGTAAVRSVAAGADLVLMTGPGSFRLVYPRLLAEARRSPSFRARVAEAARRVLALKRRLGLRSAP